MMWFAAPFCCTELDPKLTLEFILASVMEIRGSKQHTPHVTEPSKINTPLNQLAFVVIMVGILLLWSPIVGELIS